MCSRFLMELTAQMRISTMMPLLTEDQRRTFLALEAKSIGSHGVAEVSNLTGVSKNTIYKGISELSDKVQDPRARCKCNTGTRIRKEGAGRKKITESQPGIKEAVQELVEDYTLGNPENPLRYTTKSLRNIANCLSEKGYNVGKTSVANILVELGYSLQQNRKYIEPGEQHPDRDEQFKFINSMAHQFMQDKNPVISVDTKKKELIGNYKNGGQEYCPKGEAVKVNDHDFIDKEKGKASPYGVYDITLNKGFVNVTTFPDTGAFASNSVSDWWEYVGKDVYKDSKKLMITADCGGSNGRRNRQWKVGLQNFADRTGLEVYVSHLPPGTSKWNKIEHKMFCFISKNWRGRPLESLETIIMLIGSTTTSAGLEITCRKDDRVYEKGVKVPDQVIDSLNMEKNEWHGEWNYCFKPRRDSAQLE